MHPTFGVWPATSRLAGVMPISLRYCPFENYERIPFIPEKDVVIFPECGHVVDATSTIEGDMYKCAYCKRPQRIDYSDNLVNQSNMSLFGTRRQQNGVFISAIIFALDATCDEDNANSLKQMFIFALRHLPENFEFHVAIIYGSYAVFAIQQGDFFYTYDVPHSINATRQFDFTRHGNTQSSIESIINFVSNINFDEGTSSGLNAFIRSINSDANFYSRIVLFSANHPTEYPKPNCCTDLVCPRINKTKPQINGLLLTPAVADPPIDQIPCLVHEVLYRPVFFNVTITLERANYKLNDLGFFKTAALRQFHKTYTFEPLSKFYRSEKVKLLFKTTFQVQRNGTFYLETIYESAIFNQSQDFFPVACSVNPHELGRTLVLGNSIHSFTERLLEEYQASVKKLPGGATDATFSVVPELQWLLRYEYELSPDDVRYPKISFWQTPDICLLRNCPIDIRVYSLAGSPPIVVIDRTVSIGVYMDELHLPESELLSEIEMLQQERFPRPSLMFAPLCEGLEKFSDPSKGFLNVLQRQLV